MKNFLFFFILTASGFTACKSSEPKKLACKEFDAQCELQREYQFVKVISSEGNLCDAYGIPVKAGDWYIRVKETQGLIPVPFLYDNVSSATPDDFETAGNAGYSYLSPGTDDVRSDTVKIGINRVEPNTEVRILTFGSRYIHVFNSASGLKWSIEDGK